MTSKKVSNAKEIKNIFNYINSWLSNIIIEELRTDYLPDTK